MVKYIVMYVLTHVNVIEAGDLAWIRAMIPHRSMAILTGERARIRDPRVRALADKIIASQGKEIEGMKAMTADLERQC